MKYLKRFESRECDWSPYDRETVLSAINTYRYILEDDSRWKLFIIHPGYFTIEYDRGHKDYYDSKSWTYEMSQNPDFQDFMQRLKDELLPKYFVNDWCSGTKIHIRIEKI